MSSHRYVYKIFYSQSLAVSFFPKSNDSIFPEFKQKGWGGFAFEQEHYRFVNCTLAVSLKKLVPPENNNKIKKSRIISAENDDIFLSRVENDIEKIYKHYTIFLNIYQETYLLYDRNNLLKKSFIDELNVFLSIYCSVSYFGETKGYLPLISSDNPQSFFIEKNIKKDQLNLQIVTASGEKAKKDDKEIDEILISHIQKEKKLDIIDFVLICGQ